MLSPRLSHLRYFRTNPPAWSAWAVGVVALAIIDIEVGLSKGIYSASWTEWLGYGGLPVVFALAIRFALEAPTRKPVEAVPEAGGDWSDLEQWLQADAPASRDLLGRGGVASRIAKCLQRGVRSVGIVGPFGAGKSSIVQWVRQSLGENTDTFLVSEHTCWGFETSAASIHSMLEDALRCIDSRISVLQSNSLPESYLRTIGSREDWVDQASRFVFPRRDSMEQFSILSDALEGVGIRLVLVVEDLDRNENTRFDRQEVIALLHQLKQHPGISFVITGGVGAERPIDYAKLCDHIEYLRSISTAEASHLVAQLRARCLDRSVFPHVQLSPIENPWEQTRFHELYDWRQVPIPQAMGRLLQTPRVLRHALGAVYRNWGDLYGEVDFDDLLAMNVLRHAAPGAFSFALREWSKLRREPSDALLGRGQRESVTAPIMNDWKRTCSGADWDAAAARAILDFLLPHSKHWLGGIGTQRQSGVQGIQDERYWQRVLNGCVDVDEVRDQDVIGDIMEWSASRSREARLISRLCADKRYCDVWANLAGRILGADRSLCLELCKCVLDRIRDQEGCDASSNSQGFMAIWNFANRYVGSADGNGAWLRDRISEAASVSLELVNSLWHYWGQWQGSILESSDREPVRRFLIDRLKQEIRTVDDLARLMSPKYPFVVHQLVSDPGAREQVLTGVEPWAWLAPVLIEGVLAGQVPVAIGVSSLVCAREQTTRREPISVDVEVLRGFFGDRSSQLIDGIGRLLPQMDEESRVFAAGIVRSAESILAKLTAADGTIPP
jgi:hypothetical protein